MTARLQDQPIGTPLRVLIAAGAVVLVGTATALGPLVGAAALVAVAGGLVLLGHPGLAAAVGVGLAPAVSGLGRGLPVPGLRLSEALAVAVGMAALLPYRATAPRWRAVDGFALLYVVLTATLGFLGTQRYGIELDSTAVGTLLGPVHFFLLYRAAVVGLTSEHARVWALRLTLLPAVPIALLAVAQRFSAALQDVLARLTASDMYAENLLYFAPRVTGPFPHWHVLGGYLMVVALLALALLTAPRQPVAPGIVLLAGLGVVLPALLLTLTAAVVLGFGVGAVLVVLTGHRPGRSLLAMGGAGVAGLIAGWPLVASRVADQSAGSGGGGSLVPETLSTRMTIWSEQYFPVLQGRLLLGYGPTLPPEVVWVWTESLYVSLLLRGGVPLVLAHSALFAAAYLACRQVLRDGDGSGTRAIAARTVAATTLVLVPMHGIFPYFVTTGLPHLWWGLLGLALSQDPRVRSTLRP